jgi:hypothetical protein
VRLILPLSVRARLQSCGKTLGVEVLKGHGFLAMPQVFENDLRRGWKPRPFKAPAADFDVLSATPEGRRQLGITGMPRYESYPALLNVNDL